ncbi:ABC transporter substrate-binding protein [Varibaculum cambriense]|uniref:ABC transporter substrate-binding protein n=1 Tax=Varibaculum cambriense TaxID=184870 RepID=UPI002901BA7E|nr:ABC transporter substrate-binding protein [Varibaculum cambriense]MDU1224829.1 ABC transporter substrate-binding protein [Varibaculum cambriense]
MCANYDIAYFKDNNLKVPENFDDLLKPEYKGLTVIENPAKSDTGLGMLLATVQEKGKDGYVKYWKDLMANGTKAAASFLGYRPFLSAAAAAEFGMEIGEREQLAIAPGGLKMCPAGQGVAANARDLRVRRGKYLAEVSWQQGSEEYLGQAEAGLGLHLSKKQTLQAVGLQIQRSETCVVSVSS